MKYVGFAFLLCRSAFAADSFALSGGFTTISDQYGYAAQITSPYIRKVVAIQLQAGQNYFQGMPYTLAQLGVVAPFYRTETFQIQFKTGIQRFFAPSLSTETGSGVHYTLGAEYAILPKFSILGEVGYSLAYTNSANKLPGSPEFGNGFSVLIGPKIYL